MEAEARRGAVTHLEVLGNLTDESLEGQLADEELRRLLVPTNLTESDGTRPEAMGLLDTTSGGLGGLSVQVKVFEDKSTYGSLARLRLGSELLTRGLAYRAKWSSSSLESTQVSKGLTTSGLASGLLGAGHY